MKVQTSSKYEPMNLKRRMSLIKSNIEPTLENKLVLICPKLEPGKKECNVPTFSLKLKWNIIVSIFLFC